MTLEMIIAIVLGCAAIFYGCVILLWIMAVTFDGGLAIYIVARDQDFLGVAGYVACWVFMFPVMLVISFIVGLFDPMRPSSPLSHRWRPWDENGKRQPGYRP